MTTMTKLETKAQLASIAKLLLLIGGLLLLVAGAFEITDVRSALELSPGVRSIASLTNIGAGIVAVFLGILALLGTRQILNPAWNVVLLILGIVVGGLGGVLVFIGSLIGLVEIYVKR